ncbi:MAG: murein biosynthesis integral membrane protein MurJ [Chloroflexota bacterium]|nr:murein biosynthesis integral membrane protein MurJ [Chloroflexota bacterium]
MLEQGSRLPPNSINADAAAIDSGLIEIPVPAPTEAQANRAAVARATGVLALGNIASRVLGMAREVTLTNLFGASRATDAFYVAIIIPKTIYDLLIAGHVNSAIIPVLSEVAANDAATGEKELWRVVSILSTLITAILALLVVMLMIFAPSIVLLVSGGAGVDKQALATDLLRLTAPALIGLGLFSTFSGALYALRSFTLPALAGAIFNGMIVLSTVILAPPLTVMVTFDGAHAAWTAARPESGIYAAAFGWLIGATVQMLSQLPGLRGAKLRVSFNWRHPAVRRIARLYAPVMLSMLLDTVVRTFSYNLASQTGERSITYMNLATTLIQFPQGLVATAIGIAILPTLSRQALNDTPAFRETLGLGLRLAITLILPAAVGLFALATPIVMLIFEHGAFTGVDTGMTALALRLYLFGLPFAAIDLMLMYAFYARQDTLTPTWIGMFSLALYMVVAITLAPTAGVFSLMIADSAKHIIHAVIAGYMLIRRMGGLGDQRLIGAFVRTGVAAGLMGVVTAAVVPPLARIVGAATLINEIALVGMAGGISVAAYLALAWLFRVEELRWLWGLMRTRVGR